MLLQSHNPDDLKVSIFPQPTLLTQDELPVHVKKNGIFSSFQPAVPLPECYEIGVLQIREAGEPRKINMGSQGVAESPTGKEFVEAAVWRILLPECLNIDQRYILSIKYLGDVARLYLNGKLLLDDFYNGNAFEIGLNCFSPEIFSGELTLHILPLSKGVPIYIQEDAIPDFQNEEAVCQLQSIEIKPLYEVVMVSQ